MSEKLPTIRNAFDVEKNILDYFWSGYESSKCCLCVDDQVTLKSIAEVITRPDGWVDHSGKNEEPPDFINHSKQLMMEVMRVDDHERMGDDGKNFINPLRARESKLIKEYEPELRNIMSGCASNPQFALAARTNLLTDEDHSYEKYLTSFSRIVNKHAEKAALYRRNYPGYKLVFFVMDESSFCMEENKNDSDSRNHSIGATVEGRPHIHFADEVFLDAIINSNADYFVWYTPFKHAELFARDSVPSLPESVIYDMSQIPNHSISYDSTRMVSCEA